MIPNQEQTQPIKVKICRSLQDRYLGVILYVFELNALISFSFNPLCILVSPWRTLSKDKEEKERKETRDREKKETKK